MGSIGPLGVIFFCLVGPPALTLFHLIQTVTGSRRLPVLSAIVEILVFTLGPILTAVLYAMSSGFDWNEALILGQNLLDRHSPLGSWHLPTIVVLAAIALVGYAALRLGSKKLPPLVVSICIAALYVGCGLSVVWMIQVLGSANGIDQLDTLFAVYFSLFPLNYIVSAAALIIKLTRTEITPMVEPQRPRALGYFARFFARHRNSAFAGFIFLWPLLGITMAILVLFGQRPDAAIAAFAETSDWTLSQKVSPPDISIDQHYLCTVAVAGHPRLVKPLRKGVRHGREIVVNRQLLVANAFEDLITERTPRLHRAIRNVYDTYGLPVSKLIRTPVAADVTYLIMKPLEWLFLATLYLFDRKPEDRIARQYLPRVGSRQ